MPTKNKNEQPPKAAPQDNLREAALDYHRLPTPGKISMKPTTQLETQRDLALAYSPGVAIPCEEIAADPLKALDYTSRGNTVAVISNGTAVLGLGNIGALASKPVMEGKCVLFKKFANIDSFDLEVNETDVDKFVEAIAVLEPSFGGINLEDIKAPECFEIERRLKERMNIPVFHDDQHGTAIIVSAAFTNWLEIMGRDIKQVKLVANGAGASAMACLNLMVELGLPRDNITVCDREGVIYKGRIEGMDPYKEKYANETNARDLKDAIEGADVFLGLSGPNMVTAEMAASMADAPLIMALANPTPEIMPDVAHQGKPNAIVCTGRSDFTNQVNNVLCFPFLFRGALDVGATAINEEMKIACVKAIAALARKEVTPEVAAIYPGETMEFGPQYMIPKPFDPRLGVELPIAVAKAAMDSGVATRPIKDFNAYREKLKQFHIQSNQVMRPVFDVARKNPKKIVYAEGEEENVLRAVQMVVDEGIGHPTLIGRRAVVLNRIQKLRLRLEIDKDFDLCDPEDDPRYKEYRRLYHDIMKRNGISPAVAKTIVRTNTTVIASLMLQRGEVDAMICGTVGDFHVHMRHVGDIVGLKPGVETAAALRLLIMPNKGSYFVCDTHVNPNPSVPQISEMTILAAERVKRFGIEPRVALLSYSNFGSRKDESASKMSKATLDIKQRDPTLMVDGEMHADTALSQKIRDMHLPDSTLKGEANLLIMPNIDAANISFNMLKVLGEGIPVGPILLGVNKPAHILTSATTARGILNMSAVAVVEAVHQQPESQTSKAKSKKAA
ncbi:MAG: NADP-dependent malic enzyme [Alphaproteobacteria bacterium]|nr:NADP-dependent malic enzyme [Alphaproteobacteria bacterium]NCQ88266.1 NADP-dependent malic enzyme [Alphaproteobacteria bacterium]NCT05227.1 NADP-dependent malic enzyme [Alphaproteobacteria bacterium]